MRTAGAGRVYLPAADLAAFGVPESRSTPPASSPALRTLMAHETGRAVAMLDDGAALVGRLRGWARLAVAGYVAGGLRRRRRAAPGRVRGAGRQPRHPALGRRPAPRHPSRPPDQDAEHLMIRPSLEDAYAACEAITRREARNFYYGIRLLPPQKRSALCAVYALARRIDDIGDEEGPFAEKATALAAVRDALHGRGGPGGSGDGRRHRRRRPLPDPDGRVRGARRRGHRRRADGRRPRRHRRVLRDLRRHGRLLPQRGRLRRAALPGDLRLPASTRTLPGTPTRSASRCSRPTSCATSARTCRTGASTCRGRSWSSSGPSSCSTSTACWWTSRAGWPS